MDQKQFVFTKEDLKDTIKWPMSGLKSQTKEWGCDDGLSHRWHYINKIFGHVNNLKEGTVCI